MLLTLWLFAAPLRPAPSKSVLILFGKSSPIKLIICFTFLLAFFLLLVFTRVIKGFWRHSVYDSPILFLFVIHRMIVIYPLSSALNVCKWFCSFGHRVNFWLIELQFWLLFTTNLFECTGNIRLRAFMWHSQRSCRQLDGNKGRGVESGVVVFLEGEFIAVYKLFIWRVHYK